MKFQITFKTPDVCYNTIKEVAAEGIDECFKDVNEEERGILIRSEEEALTNFLSKWVEYDELVTIEFDTVEETAVVKKI